MVTHMKTTIELPDDLVGQVRDVARDEHTTMRELMIEGLRLALERRQAIGRAEFVFPTFAGNGLAEGITGANLIDASYGLAR